MMRGPMLQSLLEERFKLKVHQEDKEVPVYGLVIGRGGPKLTASKEDGCTPIELFDPMTRPSPGQRPPCGPFGPDAVGGIVTYASTLALLWRNSLPPWTAMSLTRPASRKSWISIYS
jgi:uncharacterized protein (TIGR03435 family)